MERYVNKINGKLSGEVIVPGDKSISHRAAMFGAIANKNTEIEGFLMGEDCLSTVACMQDLGIEINVKKPGSLIVKGMGLDGLREPMKVLDVGNSGTTTRLLMGILSGQEFHSVLKGDHSLSSRPMGRVTEPLKLMGSKIDGREGGTKAPLAIRGGNLNPITYQSPVASAQVKSALILAGLYAQGKTTVIEPARSRDHTERMLKSFGAEILTTDNSVSVLGLPQLEGQKITVPGDISSAAFFMVAACIVPHSEVNLLNVGINPTRTGIIDILIRMGAQICIENKRIEAGEPVADITIKYSQLKGVTVSGDDIPRLIDEIPVLAVAAAHAEGKTIIKDAQELKVKETNRIDTVVSEMSKMGMDIEAREDGMEIKGGKMLEGAVVDSHHDHRIAMALAVAALTSEGKTTIKNVECINISFPGFFEMLSSLEA